MVIWRVWAGYRYSTPPSPPRYTPPRVHLLPATGLVLANSGCRAPKNMVVGLKSVAQLSLVGHFSDIRGITEVYNVGLADNPNDHNVILGNK